ncbi:MAG: hypothetical protein ABSD31_04375 [Candidatus Binataceae bacterium]|jgi:hypothetical protein
MTKRATFLGAGLFVLALVIAAVAPPASSATFYSLACQGSDVGLAGAGLGYGSDSALWTVQVKGTTLTGGTSVTMYTNNPGATGSPALTCFYSLDAASTVTTVSSMILEQTLVWDPVVSPANPLGCSGQFTDHVFVINGSATAQMIDDNLDDDNVAGAGSCTKLLLSGGAG